MGVVGPTRNLLLIVFHSSAVLRLFHENPRVLHFRNPPPLILCCSCKPPVIVTVLNGGGRGVKLKSKLEQFSWSHPDRGHCLHLACRLPELEDYHYAAQLNLPACLSARNGTTREEKWQPRPVTLSNLFIGPRMFIADTPFRSSCSITVGIHRSSHAIPNKFAPALVGLFSRFDKQRCFSSSAVEASPSPSSSSYWGLGASTKTHARSLVSTRTRRTWRMWRRGQKKLLHAIWESASPPPVHHHPAAAAVQVLHDGGYSVWWP